MLWCLLNISNPTRQGRMDTAQDLEEKWANATSIHLPKVHGLKLVLGAWQIPHPEKFHHGAWEGSFLCGAGSGAGIFELYDIDRNQQVDPVKMVQHMAAAGRKACERTRLHASYRSVDRAAETLNAACRSSGSLAACVRGPVVEGLHSMCM